MTKTLNQNDFRNIILGGTDHIAILTLVGDAVSGDDNTRKMCVLHADMIDQIFYALQVIREDEMIRCVIITGMGKTFVAGADINEILELDNTTGESGGEVFSSSGHNLMMYIRNFPKPVIAAVNGFALGGGYELACACHIILASDKAKIGQPEVSLGVIAGFGGTQILPRRVGVGNALLLLLTGDIIPAKEAYDLGLVQKVIITNGNGNDELLDVALDMATRICKNGPQAMKLTLHAVIGGLELPDLNTALEFEADHFRRACDEEKNEGCIAYREKREPTFSV